MLTSTFIHAQGVGLATERSLWRQGAATWQEFLADPGGWRIAPRQRQRLCQTLARSVDSLENRRVDYFARALPQREHWRALSSFGRIAFLDIETDGGYSDNCITVVGLYDGYETRTYIKSLYQNL